MSLPSLAAPVRQPAAWATFPAKTRGCFARLRGRFGTIHGAAWACSLQPDHLLAYATWDETLADADDGAPDARPNQ